MAQAKVGDKVSVHYTGKLDDGTVFDSSDGREPLEFEIGTSSVIPGFEHAVVGMEPGRVEDSEGTRREGLWRARNRKGSRSRARAVAAGSQPARRPAPQAHRPTGKHDLRDRHRNERRRGKARRQSPSGRPRSLLRYSARGDRRLSGAGLRPVQSAARPQHGMGLGPEYSQDAQTPPSPTNIQQGRLPVPGWGRSCRAQSWPPRQAACLGRMPWHRLLGCPREKGC